MNLPTELWKIILLKTTRTIDCQNLFKAFSTGLRIELADDYRSHLESLKRVLAIATDNGVIVYVDNKKYTVLDPKHKRVKVVRFRPQTFEIAIPKKNGIHFWNYLTQKFVGKIETSFENLSVLEFSKNGQFMAISSENKNEFEIWDLAKMERYLFTVTPHFTYPDWNLYKDLQIEFHPFKQEVLISAIWIPSWVEGNLQYQTICWNFLENFEKNLTNILGPITREIQYSNDGETFEYCILDRGIYNSNNQCLFETKLRINEFVRYDDIIYYLRLDRNRNYRIESYNLQTKRTSLIYKQSNNFLADLRFLRNGKELAVYCFNEIKVIDVKKRKVIKEINKSMMNFDEDFDSEDSFISWSDDYLEEKMDFIYDYDVRNFGKNFFL